MIDFSDLFGMELYGIILLAVVLLIGTMRVIHSGYNGFWSMIAELFLFDLLLELLIIIFEIFSDS